MIDLILAMLTQGPAVMIDRPAATRCAEVRSPKRPAVPPKVAGQTYCLQKLERATTTIGVPRTLLNCQSLGDQGSLVCCTRLEVVPGLVEVEVAVPDLRPAVG